MDRFKVNIRIYISNYFRTIAFIFLFLIVLLSFLLINEDNFLKAITTNIARFIPRVVVGNLLIAYIYTIIKKKHQIGQ